MRCQKISKKPVWLSPPAILSVHSMYCSGKTRAKQQETEADPQTLGIFVVVLRQDLIV